MTRFLTILFTAFLAVSNVRAANLEIGVGTTIPIADTQNLANTDQYDNKGILEIASIGTLNIAAGVVNIEPLGEGIEGLDLGVVRTNGIINAAQTIRFQEGSEINGSIFSGDNIVVLDGASMLSGHVQAKKLVFNASQHKDEKGNLLVSQVDLTSVAAPDVEEWIVNGPVQVAMNGGELTINSLVVEGSGTSLNVSESFTVLGNYTGGAGSTIVSKPDDDGVHGTITLLGGGVLEEGTNNLIMQSSIFAKELRVKNHTKIAQQLAVYGAFTVLEPESGKNSLVEVDHGLQTSGKMTVESGGTLRLKGESSSDMVYFGYYYYNGLFFGGLDLQNGATLEAAATDQTLSIALGDTSEIHSGAKITAKNVHFAGLDTSGSTQERFLNNSGSLTASGLFQLTSVAFENDIGGELKINGLKLATESTLYLSESDKDNGGLNFIGENPYVEISGNSVIVADGKTLDFTGVKVVNNNTEIGIQAKSIVFGADGSLAGAGGYNTNATFKSGSKINLDYNGHLNFGNNAVWLQEGSSIALTIGTNGVGAILTNGKVTMDEGVILEVVDGSNYDGRTKIFQIIQGSEDSTFTELTMKESLFFKLNGTGSDGEGGLYVEIVKVADLVDYVKSSNQRNLGLLIDQLIKTGTVSDQQKIVFDALMRAGNDTVYQQGLDNLTGASRENAILFALSSPWRIPLENMGFHRLSLALETNTAVLNQEQMISLGQGAFRKPKQFSSRWSPSHDLWGNVYYNYTKFNEDGNAPGGNGSRGGFYAGTALPSPSKESLLGISVGYSAGQYKQSSDKVDLGDFQIGVYGGVNLFARNLQLRGYVGYGIQNYDMKRNVFESLLVSGKAEGNSMSAALYLIRPVDITERYLVKPTLGIDMERLTQDGFTETGSGAIALSYNDTTLMRTMFRLGITGDYKFDRLALNGRFMYGVKIAGDNTVSADHRFLSPADVPFRIDSVSIGSSMFDLGFGGNIGLNRLRTALLFLDYNATLGKNSSAHTASLGVLWKR